MIFAKLIRHYIGMKFGSGKRGKDGVIGCLDLVHDILRRKGKTVPDEWRGLTIENYGEWAKENPNKVNEILTELAREVGREIPLAAKLGGDVLIMEQAGRFFPAIYIGNENAIAAFTETGVTCFRIDEKQKAISAWRI
jgi:hypothetical protein